LLFKKRLQFEAIQRTNVRAEVSADALRKYFDLFYPGLGLWVEVSPGYISLSGTARLFGKNVPVQLAGNLEISGPKNLRFFPERLYVSGRPVPRGLLRFIGTQWPLEFTILESWPLKLTGLILQKGRIFLFMREMNYNQAKIAIGIRRNLQKGF
jgi:hypothetical protein